MATRSPGYEDLMQGSLFGSVGPETNIDELRKQFHAENAARRLFSYEKGYRVRAPSPLILRAVDERERSNN